MAEPTERQQANIDLAQRAFDLFNAGETGELVRLASEDLETHISPALANSGTYHGHQGFLDSIGQWLEAWDDFKVELLDVEPVGERHVIAATRQSAKGKGSGIPVDMPLAYLTEVGDEQLQAVHLYATVEEARQVAEEREGS